MITRAAVVLCLLCLAPQAAFTQTSAQGSDESQVKSAPAARSADSSIRILPRVSAAFTQDQIRELIQKVADNDIENDKKQRNYTYIQREEERKLNGKGEVQSTESTTSEVMMIYGSPVSRQIAKNDRPLSPKQSAKEEERIQRIIEKREHETEEQRRKRLREEEKNREEGRQWVREISDAFIFRLVGIEDIAGRQTYVVDAEPRPGFRPHLKYANYLPKFRFRVWLDKAELQWVKLDAECIDNLSFGLFLARLHKGAHVLLEQTRVNDEVWLPKHEAVKLEARLALVKNFRVEEDTTYRDYRKFRANAKIVGVGEGQEQK